MDQLPIISAPCVINVSLHQMSFYSMKMNIWNAPLLVKYVRNDSKRRNTGSDIWGLILTRKTFPVISATSHSEERIT